MIDEYRKEIDIIDKQIMNLFALRMDTVHKIIQYKLDNNLHILNKNREVQLKNELMLNIPEKYKIYYSDFLDNLLLISKKYQKDIKDIL